MTTHLDMNWRQVWLWSAVISAALSLVITFGSLGYPSSAADTLWQYMVHWTGSTALLTTIGVLAVFRATFDPAREFAERQRARQGLSENSAVAVAITQILTWIAKTFGTAGDRARK